LRLVVLRQRDPKGEQLPADEMEVVARSDGLAQRLDNQPGFAVYEQTLEFAVDPAGRYALRVEGRIPTTTRPASAPLPTSQHRSWELKPRIFLDGADEESRKQGRPIFLDYAPELGALGVPADARALIAVGSAAPNGQPRPYATEGSPLGVELVQK